MKCTSLAAVKKLPAKPVYLVIASDLVEREEILENVCQGERVVLEGARVAAEALAVELGTSSLFGKEQTVVVNEVDKLSTAVLDWLRSYCEAPGGKRLVLVAASLRPGKLQQAVAKEGVVIDLGRAPPWEKEKGALAWVKSQGLGQRAAARLVAMVGPDKGLLAGEVEKLRTYVGDGVIEESAVAELAVGRPTEAIWDLGKAVMARDAQKTLRVWRSLRAEGVAPLALVATLRGQMRKAGKGDLLVEIFELESKLKDGYLADELFETALIRWASI